ncbi:MAG: hypothetical protein FWD71_08545 [Oscillospiraceae bacterium]|nr:hypothetical protein [Oscillospiraceae bacterium]
MKWYMKSIITFKNYLTQSNIPSDIREYVKELDEEKLNWFYNQMKEPMEFLTDVDYLFYKFRWISICEFDDLSKEIFLQSIFNNAEGIMTDIIKSGWFRILYDRYEKDIYSFIDEISS